MAAYLRGSERKSRSVKRLLKGFDQLHAAKFAQLDKPQRDGYIAVLHKFGLLDEWQHTWRNHARPEQLAPPGNWQYWLFMAGRGAGKTRAGVEWVREKIKAGYRHIGLIAPTTDAARKVMVEGSSGILANSFEFDLTNKGYAMGRPVYEPSKRQLHWACGATATVYTAEEPERLRGPQHDALWCDELASWPHSKLRDSASETWDNAMFGLRVGPYPQAMISTTPKPIPLIRELIRQSKGERPTCVITKASTYQNRPNLAASFFSHIISKYEGTRLGRQELLGDVIEEAEGALWTRETIERARGEPPREFARTVVAVDPAVSTKVTSSLTGIVVAGIGWDKRGYVLADYSGRYTPHEWATRVMKAWREHGADKIIAEGNQGGDLVRQNLRTVYVNAPLKIVYASHSKQARAEPIAALYEQGKVSHCAAFAELEDQLCTWEPLSSDPSPDRLDAMVWALTELMLIEPEPPIVQPYFFGIPRNIPGQ